MRTLSVKGGIKRSREAQVILPMHRSIVDISKSKNPTMVDFTALISTYKPESRLKLYARRLAKLITFFL